MIIVQEVLQLPETVLEVLDERKFALCCSLDLVLELLKSLFCKVLISAKSCSDHGDSVDDDDQFDDDG
eukprot:126405-Hanusia_phi.AAC.1